MNVALLLNAFDLIGDAPEALQHFRKLVVGLAVAGRLSGGRDDWANRTRELRALVTGDVSSSPISLEELPEAFTNPGSFVRLGAIARIERGTTGIMTAVPGPYPLVVTAAERGKCDHYDFDGAAAIVPLVSSAGHGKASLQRLHYQEGRFALGSILAAIFPRNPELISARFLYEYLTAFKHDLLVSRMIGTANVSLSVGKIADVPVPLVMPEVQRTVDKLMTLCDRLEVARIERENRRDQLATACLTRLIEFTTDSFPGTAQLALDALTEITTRPDQIQKLRQAIINLAVRGKLVQQSDSDEPASSLLKRVSTEKLDRKRRTGDARIKSEPNPSSEALPMALPDGWAVQSFENLFLFIDYRGNTPPKTERGVPLITAKNIRMGYLNREPREYIAEDTFRSWMTRGFPQLGDLFFTTEAPLANVCLNDIQEPFALAQRSICLQPYSELNTKFLMFALMSDVMQTLLEANATGMTAKGIKAAKLKPLPIPIPPQPEQHRIVAKVDELMALCDRLEAALQLREGRRSGLLKSLLSEALQPTDEREEAA